MDLRISPDDRVGTQPKRTATRPQAKKSGWGRGRRDRVEPTMGQAVGGFVDDERSGGGSFGGGGGGKGGGKPPKRGSAKPVKQPKRRKRGGFLMGLLYWGFVMCLWGGLAVIGVVVYYGAQLPSSDTWAIPDRPPNIRILAADGSLMSNRGQTGGEAVTYRELPYYVPAAIIASEDRRYMSHFGVDPVGLLAVLVESLQAREVTRGASTITQQVAKNLFLTPDQTLGRKVQEAILAIWLEQNYTKEEILELYFNRVYFGAGATGIEAAAQTYFGVSARNLSLGQAAMLAGILPAPSAYNPKTNPDRAKERQRLTLNSMAEEGYITREEADAARIDPNQTIRTRVAGSESYVADWVESLMQAYVGDVEKDVIVHTTVNWDLQKEAELIVREMVASEGPKRGFNQGALVAMDVDGTVRAMVGGVDYQASQYNRAVTARRQPGSTFKPFVYLAAMEKGYTPETIAEDAQFDYQGWSPRNATNKYAGTVTLRQGLAYSLNTIAARLAIDVTPQVVIDTATRMGISTPMTPVPSIGLGTQEVSLLELTSAYAPFANGGIGIIPNVITRIETVDGDVLYEASQAGPGQVIAPNILAEMNDMLKTAVEVGTGKGANLNGWPFAGKTGTSQNSRDALFIGYTARMVTGVWLGNDNDTKTSLSGGNVPVAIWSQFMTKAHEGLQVADIPGGSYAGQMVAQQIVDPATGMPVIDPNTGAPMVQYVDAQTGQPVQSPIDTGMATQTQPQIDPATGQPAQPGFQVDPNTGLATQNGVAPSQPVEQQQNGFQIDPATGMVILPQADPNAGMAMEQGQPQVDPATGFPLEAPPVDPNTGMPLQVMIDPNTGQQVYVTSQPVPPQPVYDPNAAQPTPQQSEGSQRTLMDLIFGG